MPLLLVLHWYVADCNGFGLSIPGSMFCLVMLHSLVLYGCLVV
jgi:hypothetical protein